MDNSEAHFYIILLAALFPVYNAAPHPSGKKGD